MDFSWILLALFLVVVIRGVCKALSKSMLKNTLRLGAVIVAFLITFALQLGGVFQNAIASVVELINLAAMFPMLAGAADLISGLASTVAGPIIFVFVFFPILWVLRIVIHFVVKAVEKPGKEKAEPTPVEPAPAEEAPKEEPAPEERSEETPAEDTEAAGESACADAEPQLNLDGEEAPAEESAPTEEAPKEEPAPAEEAPVAEVTAEPVKESKPKKEKKKKKSGIYPECAWKRVISLSTGAIAGILVFSVVLMPLFYLMSVATTATHALDNSDADDSQIYKIVEVADEYIVSPYENSFVYKFYNTVAITDLLNYTAKAGGKITLENGTVVYADDVLKGLIAHGVSAAAQLTSAKSECSEIKGDVQAIISDPMISSIAADVVMTLISQIETEEPAEDDLMGGLVANFVDYYRNADKPTIEKDLQAAGGAIGVLAEERVIAMLLSENIDLEALLSDRETLGDVVEAISGLSAFTTTVEGAFELGIDMLGEALHIPENDAEVYEDLMNELVAAMVKSPESAYSVNDYNTVRGFIKHVGDNGEKVTKYKGTASYNKFMSYYEQWKIVQSAFAHASEDRSFGYFTIEISGDRYIYDNTANTIVKFEGDAAEEYKNKISPVAGIINALTRYASVNELTRDNIYTILDSYAKSASADEVSRELAGRILAKEGFTSNAVTIEKLHAATNFSAWEDEAVKAQDSRLCVDIIIDLLGIMETLGNIENVGGIEGAGQLADYFVVIGSTLDIMEKTGCINELPELLIEGLIKSDMISDFVAPSFAFQSIEIVKNNDNKTYVDVMTTVTNIIKMGINSFGGMMK